MINHIYSYIEKFTAMDIKKRIIQSVAYLQAQIITYLYNMVCSSSEGSIVFKKGVKTFMVYIDDTGKLCYNGKNIEKCMDFQLLTFLVENLT